MSYKKPNLYNNSLQSQNIEHQKVLPQYKYASFFESTKRSETCFLSPCTRFLSLFFFLHRWFNLSTWRWWKRCGMRIVLQSKACHPAFKNSQHCFLSGHRIATFLYSFSEKNNISTHHLHITMEAEHTLFPPQNTKHAQRGDCCSTAYLQNCNMWDDVSHVVEALNYC